MKRLIILGGLVAALSLMASAVQAGYDYQVTPTTGDYSYGQGGEFTITNAGIPLPGAQVFQTFCVEVSETFWPGTTYYAQISTASVYTGYNLTNGAAWLYCEFVHGNLDDYAYGGNPQRVLDAGLLQQTIWYFMGVGANPGGKFYADAVAQFGEDHLFETNQIGCTRVLNLSTSQDGLWEHRAQDMLICIPVPGAALLGVLGLSLVGWVKRRLA